MSFLITFMIQSQTLKLIEIVNGCVVVTYPYDPSGKFQCVAKTVMGWRYADGKWTFPLGHAADVIDALSIFNCEVSPGVQEAAEQQRQKQAEYKRAQLKHISRLLSSTDLSEPLPNGWTLRNYQQEGVQWLLAHSRGGLLKGGILADQPGLGKSIISLKASQILQSYTGAKIVVICPVSIKLNWHKEASYIGLDIEVHSWGKIPPSVKGEFILIADEAHLGMTETSARSKAMVKLAHSANCVAAWLLTGTPMKNGRPVNLFPLLKAIGHPLANDKRSYLQRYCRPRKTPWGWSYDGADNLIELNQKTNDGILRRLKKDCLPELPEKQTIVREIELSSSELKDYEARIKTIQDSYQDRVQRGEVKPGAEALIQLNAARQISSLLKVPYTIELALETLEQGESVVIFTEFIESAQLIHKKLGGELLTGSVDQKERQAMVDRFQAKTSRIFIGTIKAGGVGLTLTAANDLILHDRPWDWTDLEQASDRVHRLGQSENCFIYWMRLVGKIQIDEEVDALVDRKSVSIEKLLEGKEAGFNEVEELKKMAKRLKLI
ncbi:DEAD/DEAH box helicase [Leptolyngbya sp. AN03gr2]|uniref:DEAD/DEAH box helicase n=1 Tax=Leptolyngbya sp. AN03gr2 TaxID=3423364 RepID=UPI003D31A203